MISMLQFRDARVADIPTIVGLVTRAYRGEASRAGWTTEADLLAGQRIDPEVLRHDIQRPRSRVLLADRDGALVACAHLAVEDGGREGTGYFGMFAVEPGLQGGGTGRAVLAEAERIMREEFGMARLQMTVIAQRTKLIDWYGRRGYRRTGATKPFPYGDERFGVPLRDDLRFEVLEKELEPR